MPTAAVGKEPEVAVRGVPLSALVETKTGVRGAGRVPGGNSWKVTVPVGVTPPATVAVSKIDVPTGPPAEGAVVIVGGGRLLVNVHAIGCAAAPVNVAVVPVTRGRNGRPATEHCALTKVYPAFSASVTVTVGVAAAGMVTAAGATPLAPLTRPLVAVGVIVLPLEIVLVNVHPLASAGVGLIRAPVGSWICLVIVSWLLQAPVASCLRTSPKPVLELRK